MKTLTTILLFIASLPMYAQVDDVYVNPQIPNAFVGGEDSLMKYIDAHFDFCKKSQNLSKTESIIARFVVEPNGTYSNLTFMTNNAETTRLMVKELLDSLPEWKPGTVKGKPVRSYRHLAIRCENGLRVKKVR
ncbi:hypothetical protein [Emticicia agri]|uniref:TonB C-terminal domain-containing protein n=1 Tax=Emticicia agri TaxID=2492393 RepID=A0A4Q5LUA4_9BACT|nr:hypothetical protein [Emticicia agri]RYU93174.1 hypothetical protein EWM59_23370 [Emticicia agri]